MNSSEKEALVGEFSEAFSASAASFLIAYQGTKCEDLTRLRRKLNPIGAKIRILKNSLAERAVKGTGNEKLSEYLIGPTAVVWSKSDPVQPAKIIAEFVKELETFKVKGGIVDGQLVDAAAVNDLSKLPSREELLSRLLSVINAPATKLLRTMNAPATQLVTALEAWRKKVEEKGGAPVEQKAAGEPPKAAAEAATAPEESAKAEQEAPPAPADEKAPGEEA